MAKHSIPEPKINRIIKSFSIQVCEVEGYDKNVILVENKQAIPHEEVIELLQTAQYLLIHFLEDQN